MKYYRFIDVIKRLFKSINPTGKEKFTSVDYCIVSFPKSGRGWLRVEMAEAIKEQFSFDIDPYSYSEPMQMIYKVTNRKLVFTHDNNPHLKYPWEIKNNFGHQSMKGIIFLARDPRDIIVSLYFHRHKRLKDFQGTLDDFIYQNLGGIDAIVKYYNIWAKNLINNNTLLVRYEDHIKYPAYTLKNVLNFLNLFIDDKYIKSAVDFASFENMKRKEKNMLQKNEHKHKYRGNFTDNDTLKARRGVIGGYKDYLTNEQLSYINHKMKKLNTIYGYSSIQF